MEHLFDDFVSSPQKSPCKPTQKFACFVCNKDLSHLDSQQQTRHVNSCLDAQENVADLEKSKEKWAHTMDCPMCGEPLPPGPHQAAHAKRCSRKNQINATGLVQLMKTQKQVTDAKKRNGALHTKAPEPTSKPQKRDPLMPKRAFDEDVQLAISLSRSLDKEQTDFQPAKKRSKRQTENPVDQAKPLESVAQVKERLLRRLDKIIPEAPIADAQKGLKTAALGQRLDGGGDWSEAVSAWTGRLRRLESLSECFRHMLADTGSTDVSLMVKDNKSIMAHSNILTARCPKLMQAAAVKGQIGLHVELGEFEREVVRAFLLFLYTANCDIGCDRKSLICLAEKFEVTELVEILSRLPSDQKPSSVSPNLFDTPSHSGCNTTHSFNAKVPSEETDVNCATPLMFEDEPIVEETAAPNLAADGQKNLEMPNSNQAGQCPSESTTFETVSDDLYPDQVVNIDTPSVSTEENVWDGWMGDDAFPIDSISNPQEEDVLRMSPQILSNSPVPPPVAVSTPVAAPNSPDCVVLNPLEEPGVKLLKSSNITPMPNYSHLPTPELTTELGKFGVRPLIRKRAVPLLKDIYDATHPVVSSQEPSDARTDTSLSDQSNDSVMEETFVDDDDALEFIDSKDKKALEAAIRTWLYKDHNHDLLIKTLMYEPIDFEEFRARVNEPSSQLQVPRNFLMDFMDDEHITFYLPNDQGFKSKKRKRMPKSKSSVN